MFGVSFFFFLNRITFFASFQLPGICLVFCMFLKKFAPPPPPASRLYHFVISSIPWALCLFILFMALSTASFVKSISLYFRVWTLGLCIFLEFFSLSDAISPDSFPMIIIFCLLLCLLICLDPFLFQMFPVSIPFFSSLLLF